MGNPPGVALGGLGPTCRTPCWSMMGRFCAQAPSLLSHFPLPFHQMSFSLSDWSPSFRSLLGSCSPQTVTHAIPSQASDFSSRPLLMRSPSLNTVSRMAPRHHIWSLAISSVVLTPLHCTAPRINWTLAVLQRWPHLADSCPLLEMFLLLRSSHSSLPSLIPDPCPGLLKASSFCMGFTNETFL